jgi:reactive intermediate/imine deaminase
MAAHDERRVLGRTPLEYDYSLGMVAPSGQLVFISGQTALGADGKVVGDNNLEAQTRYVFQSMRTLLEEAGGSLGHVVKLTTFITDMTRYADFARVRREFFQTPYPANTVVEVNSLIQPDLLIEIEAVAVI